MRVVVCLPTFNEHDNLEPMIRALGDVFAAEGLDGSVLVIDDNSTDCTGALADELVTELSFVDVLHRTKKEGLGPAYLAGFKQALAGGAGLVVGMDCDFSHNPRDVPRLVAAAKEADLVLGSRYVTGGGTKNWDALRRFVSRAGALYARYVLDVPIADLTGGFKCYQRAALVAVLLERITSRGYAFQIETTYRTIQGGYSVVEVPIVFEERRAGRSKMSKSIVLEAVVRVPQLRFERLRRRRQPDDSAG